MATLKTPNGKGKYRDLEAKEDVTNYIFNPWKMPHNYCGFMGVRSQDISGSMMQISAKFKKENGVQLRHFIISFSPYELRDFSIANEIGSLAMRFFGREYQTVYAVHEKHYNPHIHIVINSVSCVDGHRYYGTKREFYAMMNYFRRVLLSYGITELVYVKDEDEISLYNAASRRL